MVLANAKDWWISWNQQNPLFRKKSPLMFNHCKAKENVLHLWELDHSSLKIYSPLILWRRGMSEYFRRGSQWVDTPKWPGSVLEAGAIATFGRAIDWGKPFTIICQRKNRFQKRMSSYMWSSMTNGYHNHFQLSKKMN